MTDHLYDQDMIELAKDVLGWESNPFAGNQTPVDPPNSWYNDLLDAVSKVLVFTSGIGQTVALTRWLKEHNRNEALRGHANARYVVFMHHSELESVPADVVKTVAKSLAEHMANRDKNDYAETSDQNKAAICRVISSAYPHDEALEGLFGEVQVDRMLMRMTLTNEIRETANRETVEDTHDLTNLLENAWPFRYHGLTLAIDLDMGGLVNGTDLPRQTRQLLKDMEFLTEKGSGTCIKLGIPDGHGRLHTSIKKVRMNSWGQEDLYRLLQFRLDRIKQKGKRGNSGLQQIASRDCESNLADFLLYHASGSPKQLLHRGNQLLERYGYKLYDIKKDKDGIDPDDLNDEDREKARINEDDLDRLLDGRDEFCEKMLRELEHYVLERDQLSRLCFHLGTTDGTLAGDNVPAKLRALLESYREHAGLEKLLRQCKTLYPAGKWPRVPTTRIACP